MRLLSESLRYGYYKWYEREEYELDTHWIELGYNQDSWEADDYDYPDTFVLSWAEITQAQQDAASELGNTLLSRNVGYDPSV